MRVKWNLVKIFYEYSVESMYKKLLVIQQKYGNWIMYLLNNSLKAFDIKNIIFDFCKETKSLIGFQRKSYERTFMRHLRGWRFEPPVAMVLILLLLWQGKETKALFDAKRCTERNFNVILYFKS